MSVLFFYLSFVTAFTQASDENIGHYLIDDDSHSTHRFLQGFRCDRYNKQRFCELSSKCKWDGYLEHCIPHCEEIYWPRLCEKIPGCDWNYDYKSCAHAIKCDDIYDPWQCKKVSGCHWDEYNRKCGLEEFIIIDEIPIIDEYPIFEKDKCKHIHWKGKCEKTHSCEWDYHKGVCYFCE